MCFSKPVAEGRCWQLIFPTGTLHISNLTIFMQNLIQQKAYFRAWKLANDSKNGIRNTCTSWRDSWDLKGQTPQKQKHSPSNLQPFSHWPSFGVSSGDTIFSHLACDAKHAENIDISVSFWKSSPSWFCSIWELLSFASLSRTKQAPTHWHEDEQCVPRLAHVLGKLVKSVQHSTFRKPRSGLWSQRAQTTRS